jgi:hypothetical protein
MATAAILLVLAAPAAAEQSLSGNVSLEGWYFPEEGAFAGQEDFTVSVAAEARYRVDLSEEVEITLRPFLRWDAQDERRTHADLREASLLWVGDAMEGEFGVGHVFWGVAESRHLVDIVNQTDLIEDPDEEEKLGQPMLRFGVIEDWGALDLFYLPYFRERTLPGEEGRFRLPVVVDTDEAGFESDLGRWHPDFAARYSHSLGVVDFGLAWFRGTSREPDIVATPTGRLVPRYPLIDQVSLDGQVTTGPWLLKLEALGRFGQANARGEREAYGAFVGGFEYTVFDAFETGADVGLLMEYLYDSREEQATTPFEDDVFAGLRLALNDVADTYLLLGTIHDTGGAGWLATLEARRRLGESWTLQLDAGVFVGDEASDPLINADRDDFVRATLRFNF